MAKSKQPRDLDRHLAKLVERELERIATDPGEHADTVEEALLRLATPSRDVAASTGQIRRLTPATLRLIKSELTGVVQPPPTAPPSAPESPELRPETQPEPAPIQLQVPAPKAPERTTQIEKEPDTTTRDQERALAQSMLRWDKE